MSTKEYKVKGNDPVIVEWLKNTPYHKKGKRSTVHSEQAKKFEARGLAKIVKS
jgi:hypothetical protein